MSRLGGKKEDPLAESSLPSEIGNHMDSQPFDAGDSRISFVDESGRNNALDQAFMEETDYGSNQD